MRTLLVPALACALMLSPTSAKAQPEKVKEILREAASGNEFVSLVTEDLTVRSPEPGSGDAQVGPGEALYSEVHKKLYNLMFNYAVLKDDFVHAKSKKIRLPAGTRLANFFLTDPNKPVVHMRCSERHTATKMTLLSGSVYSSAVCFRIQNGVLVPFFFKRFPQPPPSRLTYERIEEVGESAVGGEGRFELLYQGAGGGILRLTYREFTGEDLARPAFTQEVSYDLTANGPTEIRFKGALIQVEEASNTALRYSVLTPFKFD